MGDFENFLVNNPPEFADGLNTTMSNFTVKLQAMIYEKQANISQILYYLEKQLTNTTNSTSSSSGSGDNQNRFIYIVISIDCFFILITILLVIYLLFLQKNMKHMIEVYRINEEVDKVENTLLLKTVNTPTTAIVKNDLEGL